MKYNKAIAIAYFQEMGLPTPEIEFRFHPQRKWRFDFAWPDYSMHNGMRGEPCPGSLALEVDGGIWISGGHNRGAQIKKTWEKENEAQIIGWTILKCEPKDLCTTETVELLRRALMRYV